MNNPLVTVIIPCHNNEKTISRAIDSVLSQTYSNIELIVIDDLSTDHSVDVIKNINDHRITLIKNEINLKAGLTRNVGLNKAKGEFIAFLDADDCYESNKIELDLKFLDAHKEIDFVCNETVSMGLRGTKLAEREFSYKEIDIKSLLTRSSIFTSTVMMRNTVKERFPNNFYTSEDLYFWCEILLNKHRIAKTNRQTTYYNNQLTNRLSLNYRSQYKHEKKVVDFVYENKAISKAQRNKFKFLYFLKFLRRPIKFRIIASKEKKMMKKAGK